MNIIKQKMVAEGLGGGGGERISKILAGTRRPSKFDRSRIGSIRQTTKIIRPTKKQSSKLVERKIFTNI